jgi:hypothetical protein
MSLKIADRATRPTTTARTESGQPNLRVVSSRPVRESTATRPTETASVSGEAQEADRADNNTRVSAAGSRSRDAIGSTDQATETHATGVDEAEAPSGTDDDDPKLERPGHPAQDEVGTALESGESGTFVNGNGDEVEFEVEQGESTEDHDVYSVTVGGNEVTVNIPPGENAEEVLARLTDFYSQQPENVQGAVNTINIEPGRNPSDEYWAEEYDTPGFTSAATGGGGTITFWNGSQYVQEGIFDHEFGHNIGSAVRNEQNAETGWFGDVVNSIVDSITGDADSQNVPRGYSQAAEGDGNSVSDYGDNAIAEDFAETWEAYSTALEQGPKALAAFQLQYPDRYALIVDEVLSRDLDVAA